MKISEIVKFLETIAPPSLQEDFDNSGLIVGSQEDEVNSVLLCLDLIPEIVEEAIQNKCQLIITHHPIIFKGIKSINSRTYPGNVIYKAIQHNMSIYAMHTNFDNIFKGVNYSLAQQLELNELQILKPRKAVLKKLVVFCPDIKLSDGSYVPGMVRNAMFEAGAGHIGNYDSCSYNIEGMGTFRGLEGTNPFVGTRGQMSVQKEVRVETVFPAYLENQIVKAMLEAHPYEEVAYDIYPLENETSFAGSGMLGQLALEMDTEEFLQHVKTKLGLKFLKYNSTYKGSIKKVAVCGGAGSFLLPDALHSGAQAFITADIRYHEYFGLDNQLLLIDAGHYETERFAIDYLHELLMKNFPTFAISKTRLISNPINYL